jgi:hypothetical protein
MSKAKWSFSLILAVFLVGILSTRAFATTDPYNLTANQNGSGLDVSFTGNLNDSSDVPGRQFDIVLKHGPSVVKTYGPVALNSSNAGTFTIPANDVEVDTSYAVELYHTNDTDHASLLSSISAVVMDSNNVRMLHLPNSRVDVNGSGQVNANLTGANDLNKARQDQKVHGFYQNNTNSCASCHQTHTSNDDKNLLFKDGVYSTCSACHDGTSGAYNVFSPINDKTPDSIAGTFDVLQDGQNGSLHVADGTLKVSAAPGGNINAADGTPFSQDFDCASCHAPHGAGSNDENNLNIDPLGWGTVSFTNLPAGATLASATSAQKDGLNGKLFKNIRIYDLTKGESIPSIYDPTGQDPQAGATPYILVRTTTDSDQTKVNSNYFYKRAGVTANTPIIQTYRWGYDDQTHQDAYIPDYSLWLQEKGYPYKADTALYNDTWANLSLTAANHYNDTAKDITRSSGVYVVWRDGFAWGPGVANVKSAQVSIGIDVETTDNIRSLYDSHFVVKDSSGNIDPTRSYIPDSGTEMSKFCVACHTDYQSGSETDSTGVYSTAHRHKTMSDSLTCVRCHFAHGSEAQIMHDANDNTFYTLVGPGKQFDPTVSPYKDASDPTAAAQNAAIAYLKDPNPSSALKRYSGMTSCYSCHGGGEQSLSNPDSP